MAKKTRTRDTAADFARRSNATSRMGRHSPTTQMRFREDVPGMPAGEPDTSPLAPMSTRSKPVQRPANLADRMEEQRLRDRMAMTDRQDPGMTREQMERGSSAPGRSMRPTARPQRFEEGGMVTGSRAQISGTKFSGTF